MHGSAQWLVEARSLAWGELLGNIQGRHVRETGPKGCNLLSDYDGDIIHVEHRDLEALLWAICEVDIAGSSSVDDVYDLVREALLQELDAAEGRPVAARLVLEGASGAHSRLHAEREHWIQEYRALATGLGGAGIWLEKVSLKTRPAVSLDDVLARDDALGGLLRGIQNMELDDTAAASLANEVLSLRQKLPSEILSGEDRYDPTDPQQLKEVLEDVKELLLNRLLTTEKG